MTRDRRLLPVATGRETARYVNGALGRRRPQLFGASALFVARAAVGLAGPAVLGVLVDRVIDGEPASAMTWPIVVLVVASVVEGALAWAGPAVAAHAVEPALADLRERVVDRALHLPTAELEHAGAGDVVARVDGDVAAVNEGVREGLPQLVVAGLTILLTVVGLLALDWRLALAGLVAAPIQFHTVRWYLPRSRPLYAEQRIAEGARSQQLIESLGAADVVRALRLRDSHVELVAERADAARGLTLRATWLSTRFFGRLNLAEVVGLTSILGVGALLVRDDAVTVGAVTAASLYFQRIFDPVNTALWLLDEVQVAGAALARLVGVAALPAPPPAPPPANREAGVEIVAVGYEYESGHEVLHEVSLTIAAGERLAVVGSSGAGKSTLAKLVAGVLTPTAGAVRVGGRPVAPEDPQVALVAQEVHVFAGPLREDLLLARPDAADEELLAALTRVGADDWATRLPKGIDTVVGDGGVRLTALQGQQLALARLVLADPPVAVLDEATAEAGSAGARVLERSAEAAIAGRTAVVVAHRLSQAERADRIVVLDAGRVVEEGSHAELVARGGEYATLWEAWDARRDAAPVENAD